MTGYKIVNLDDLLSEMGEHETKEMLQSFYCKNNYDVEYFLKSKAIEFSKCSIAKTHIVFASYKGNWVIVGYFALAGTKSFVVKTKSKSISKTWKRKFYRFGSYNEELKQFNIPAPLIGQLGKNSAHSGLISGAELLKLACDKIRAVQSEVGGKFAYLECEDIKFLRDFYSQNGFFCFGERELDVDERHGFKTEKLLQLLKYL